MLLPRCSCRPCLADCIPTPLHLLLPVPTIAAAGVPSVTAWNRQELLDALSLMFANPGPFLLEVVALAERPHIRYVHQACTKHFAAQQLLQCNLIRV